ncbi:nuclear protein DGCR14 [Aspergillus avenaceus]|uniref:Nuclear protein DGCR14 n=1 Tax=Aspergillus avenaceus TaxID=36643 RepID=A0A5N6TPM1_ASPAV|nr:nuclear protein DGCR14 [Aspergillus avenaceus]
MAPSSQALTKRQGASAAMSPPPPKRIKRPSTVLDEDVYTNALSDIIARDYFPGLLEEQVKQEYLEALDSGDREWIAVSKKNLTNLMMTPERARGLPGVSRPSMTPRQADARHEGDTPTGRGGDTPMSFAPITSTPSVRGSTDLKIPDVPRLGLLEFQAKYTSEDNESFNKLLDKQNASHREKCAWIWNGNKIPSARQIAHRRREARRIEAEAFNGDQGKQLSVKTDLDARPAKPDSWMTRPENSLMFMPSSIEDIHPTMQQKAEASSRAGPKRVVYQNTRLSDEGFQVAQDGGRPPPSPSISAIKNAIAGRPHPTGSKAGYTGDETPRVNGYAFVDEDEPEFSAATTLGNGHPASWEDLRLLGSINETPNPFQVKENRKREDLHHRLVDRVARNKRAERAAQETKSLVTATPQFASSPRLNFGLRTPSIATATGEGSKLTTSHGVYSTASRFSFKFKKRVDSNSKKI